MPSFSNGWLAGFQHRESIHSRVHHGEDGSTPESATTDMIPIRQALQLYSPRDIFNCDETGLYWKRIPDRSLATRSLPGRKKEKARISALFCCNADGSEKLKPWFIGMYTPYAIASSVYYALQALYTMHCKLCILCIASSVYYALQALYTMHCKLCILCIASSVYYVL